MRVVVPYAPGLLHPRVVPSLVDQVDANGDRYIVETYEVVNVVGHPLSYPSLLADWLTCGEDVCIIEHDNESRPGFLAGFEACGEPWCFHAYDLSIPWEEAVENPSGGAAPLGHGLAPLGHTRFRAGFGDQITETLEAWWFQSSWVSRDTFVSGALNALGHVPHKHPGKAGHHHPYV